MSGEPHGSYIGLGNRDAAGADRVEAHPGRSGAACLAAPVDALSHFQPATIDRPKIDIFAVIERADALVRDKGIERDLALRTSLINQAFAVVDVAAAHAFAEDLIGLFERQGLLKSARLVEASGDGGAHGLSEQEGTVLRCLVRGLPNKTIGAELGITESTVKVHVKAIMRKISVCNRTQAALWAERHGYRPVETSTEGESNGQETAGRENSGAG